MSALLARACLDRDLLAVEAAAEEWKWTIVRPPEADSLLVTVSIASRIDDERYWLRLRCDGYPDQAPDIVVIDPETGRVDVKTAWPNCEGFRADSRDICMPICRAGFVLHPAWAQDPVWRWSSEGNPLMRVLEQIQLRLDNKARYHGRLT